eukprot:s116_g3.t1
MRTKVMEKVSQIFVVFFFCYVTVIVFAVLRVISAVFLKDTLDAAHNDEENMMAISQHQKKDLSGRMLATLVEYIERLERVFRTLDECGDGMITQNRLEQMLIEPKVQAYFKTLDVDVTETSALFHLLDDGDGSVTLDEFIDGILRCKGPARAIDQVAMHSDIKQLDKKLTKVMKAMRASSKPQKKVHLEEPRRCGDQSFEWDYLKAIMVPFNAKSLLFEAPATKTTGSFLSEEMRDQDTRFGPDFDSARQVHFLYNPRAVVAQLARPRRALRQATGLSRKVTRSQRSGSELLSFIHRYHVKGVALQTLKSLPQDQMKQVLCEFEPKNGPRDVDKALLNYINHLGKSQPKPQQSQPQPQKARREEGAAKLDRLMTG